MKHGLYIKHGITFYFDIENNVRYHIGYDKSILVFGDWKYLNRTINKEKLRYLLMRVKLYQDGK